MFEVVKQLDREITTAELVGRKFFRDLVRLYPTIMVDSDKLHEEMDWSFYTLKIPATLLFQSSQYVKVDTESIVYITLQFENTTELPLDAKLLFNQLKGKLTDE